MNKKNITQEQLNILLNTISSSNIKLDDVLQQANDMIKKEVLKQHKYPITYGKGDGR